MEYRVWFTSVRGNVKKVAARFFSGRAANAPPTSFGNSRQHDSPARHLSRVYQFGGDRWRLLLDSAPLIV